MAVLAQRVSPAHHEQGAIDHVAGIKNPGSGGVECVTFENFGHDQQHQHNDEPGKSLAHRHAEAVGRMEQGLGVHVLSGSKKTPIQASLDGLVLRMR